MDSGPELCESSLAQRRAAQLPKLRELMRRPKPDSVDITDGNGSDPDLDFVYADCDVLSAELSELYTYSELDDFALNAQAFKKYAEKRKMRPLWATLCPDHQKTIALDLIETLEAVQPERRLDTLRIVLYLLQGAFLDFSGGGDKDQCLEASAHNAFFLYEAGMLQALCTSLMVEIGNLSKEDDMARRDSGNDSAAALNRRRKSATLADNQPLRLILSALYHLIEPMRRTDLRLPAEKKENYDRLRKEFFMELGQPIFASSEPLTVVLFQMMTSFCSGSNPHFPMKKVLLLLWKTLLAWLGGWEDLRRMKDDKRKAAGLPSCEDTLTIAKTMKPAPAPHIPSLGGGQGGDPDGGSAMPSGRRRGRPPLARRQMACVSSDGAKSPDDDDDEPQGLPDAIDDADDEVMIDVSSGGKTDTPSDTSTVSPLDDNGNNDGSGSAGDGASSRRPDSPAPQSVPRPPEPPTAPPLLPKTLPWKPKVRENEIEQFLEHERAKFFDYQLPGDAQTVFGLPQPIHQSVAALRKHVYVSMTEQQIKTEERLSKYCFSLKETEIEETPAEILYRHLLPNIPQYMIALLKIMLAAAPSSKAKSEAINILSDVLTPETDSAQILTASGSSYSLDASSTPANILEQSVRVGIDVNRHKEIVVKAASSILLLLLKHFRLNHVYQFEYLGQHLVFANCIPLILKFFDQKIAQYIQSKNDLNPWNFPQAVLHYAKNESWPELSLENLELSDTQAGGYYVWRNLFSAINLLRILNKLTKWKHARTMMLVVFKSAPILKRSLRVKQALFQLYCLKLLKMQAKYLGRQWRKSNMEIMSSIYSKVRHRLNDDWAYGNETQSKPWDFQNEESALKFAVERFNARRYGDMIQSTSSAEGLASWNFNDPEFQPYDNNIVSVLGAHYELTDRFKVNYEKWLEREVFRANVDWDQLLALNKGIANQ
uniref:Uncharacterized protein n=1 Tax=Plectus sambesii TaxID=2011161 RepID=A0A914WKF0_9BILA